MRPPLVQRTYDSLVQEGVLPMHLPNPWTCTRDVLSDRRGFATFVGLWVLPLVLASF